MWIQSVWDSDGIPEILKKKLNLEKKSADEIKNYTVGSVKISH